MNLGDFVGAVARVFRPGVLSASIAWPFTDKAGGHHSSSRVQFGGAFHFISRSKRQHTTNRFRLQSSVIHF
jgi:hypothetical protein